MLSFRIRGHPSNGTLIANLRRKILWLCWDAAMFYSVRNSVWFCSLSSCLTVAAVYALFTLSFGAWWDTYELNPDEGLNLGKAALVANGYHPYRDIWNDQPPLFTLLLAQFEFLFPNDVLHARLLVLFFACLLLGNFFGLVRRDEGVAAACFAIIVLIGGPIFQQTSIAVMIGLPAASIAMVSLGFGISARTLRGVVLSGMIFGLALQTKFFVAMMAPAAILYFAVSPSRQTLREKVLAMAAWLLAATIVFSLINMVTGQPFKDQIVGHHFELSKSQFELFGSLSLLIDLLMTWPILVPLGCLGAGFSILHPSPARAVPLTLLMISLLVLSNHRPLFHHQTILVAIPLAWLSGIFVSEIYRIAVKLKKFSLLLRMAFPIGLLLVAFPDTRQMRAQVASTSSDDQETIRELKNVPSQNKWLFTDRPMDAYRAGLLVPPSLVVFSHKRILTTNLDQSLMEREIVSRRPTHIMFRRFPELAENLSEFVVNNGYQASTTNAWKHYISSASASAPDFSERAEIVARLNDAARLFKRWSVSDGFPGLIHTANGASYERSISEPPLESGSITMRPPGSTILAGACFLRIAQISGDADLENFAGKMGRSIACSQTENGGWVNNARPKDRCLLNDNEVDEANGTGGTFDEGTTPAALNYLLDLRDNYIAGSTAVPRWLGISLDRGFEYLLRSQGKEGGWPRDFPATESYSSLYTLNDGATTDSILVLLKGFHRLSVAKYLDAARLGGEFLLKAQGKIPQEGWAQQYDENLRPAAARSFEPAAYSSIESAYAMNALLSVYRETGDARYLNAVTTAARWLTAVRASDGTWARFYEIGSNRPIFGDRDGKVYFHLSEISEERRNGYQWVGKFPSVTLALAQSSALLSPSREAIQYARFIEATRNKAESKAIVSQLLKQSPEGYFSQANLISTAVFNRNCKSVLDYLN